MPWKVMKKSGPKLYKILRSDTGAIVGSFKSHSKAQASVRARHANSPESAKTKKGFPG